MVRVPLILWGPGVIGSGVIEEPVQLIDLMPTLLDLCGLPPPEGAQGRSLRPLLAGAGGATAAASASGAWQRRPVISEKQPLLAGSDFPNAAESYAIVDGDWKLIQNVARPSEKPEFELFEFYKDPLDQKDLARSHPEVVEKLAKQLADWRGKAQAARLKPDSEQEKSLSAEQLERLRSLGYVK
jgi:arylsulfatase A-like enzyme